MSEHIKNLLTTHNRRLHKLQLQKAKFGSSTPPHILVEIEDIEAEIEAEIEIERVQILGMEQDKLKNNLADLDRLAEQGIPVAEAQAQVRKQLVVIQNSEIKAGDGAVIGSTAGRDIKTGDNLTASQIFVVKDGGRAVFNSNEPIEIANKERPQALQDYLKHLISRNRHLQLQGIRSGGRTAHIKLDQIYITLRATRQRVVTIEEKWLKEKVALAPGEEVYRQGQVHTTEIVTVSVNEVLQYYNRLVVLGDPGSGKTTLLRYLALLYAGDMADKKNYVKNKLGLDEKRRLPIMLYLRQIGTFLRERHSTNDGTEGHDVLLEFLYKLLKSDRVELPANFFDDWLKKGEAVIFLDGLDEVADSKLRQRVARLVESFTRAYPECRYIVTSRIVGYSGTARLGENYNTTTVKDFTMADIEQFLTSWHRMAAVGLMGEGRSAEIYAAQQTAHLKQAIEEKERIRELAVNPLMLTVIAMIHRDRVKLPDRRAELYAEAVDVLLGKWEEAKGVMEVEILPGQPFDTGDKRLMLQNLALYMQERELKEVETAELKEWLTEQFLDILDDKRIVERAINRFLRIIEERTGLLGESGEGVYAFSHLTFQEYLAALAIAGRDDYVAYALKQSSNPWWREVILLTVGYLSTQSREKTTALIQAIADKEEEPKKHYNLVLATKCLKDVGGKRVSGTLEKEVHSRLRANIELKLTGSKWHNKEIIKHKAIAIQALISIGEWYWTKPYGEPEWVNVPAGTFLMGSDSKDAYDKEKPHHKVYLDKFQIARVPTTNDQYHLFTQATGYKTPSYWEDNHPPKGLEIHPVVNVSWHDAIAYCGWLSEVTGKTISLPTEAQWEKAARGDKDSREYSWGNEFVAIRCNSYDLGLRQTTPVGVFPDGASPYGCLDMSGNVREWCSTVWGAYPFKVQNELVEEYLGRATVRRLLRGGSFVDDARNVRCACRYYFYSDYNYDNIGFRVGVV